MLETGGISELERLLKQKTFTRGQSERLVELLRSRTVEPVSFEKEVNNENKEKANSSAEENGRSSKLPDLSAHAGSLTIPQDEAASPAELAKAYMGSRSLNISSSAVGLRSQAFREDTDLANNVLSKPLDFSVPPRSVIRFSGIPELPEISQQTPRPRGRSSIYRMSRSPYFKVNPTANVKVGELTKDGYAGPSSSKWTPRNAMHSDSKQVLKRGSSVLDSDFGSFGPIRRIRHKSNLMSPSRDTRSPLSGNLLPSSSTPFDKVVVRGSTSRTPLFGERKFNTAGLQGAGNGDNTTFGASAASLPPQSSETAQKILQHLDKLLPSPKEKLSEPKQKTAVRDESPFELTPDMLHGRAHRSMKDIDSSKILNVQGSGDLHATRDSTLPSLKVSLSQKHDNIEGNGPFKPAAGVKLAFEANGIDNAVIPAADVKSGMGPADFVLSKSAALPQQKKPSFQMSAPEDSLEIDDDNYNVRDVSRSSPTRIDELGSEPEHKTVISETSENSVMPSSQSMPISSAISFGEAEKKVTIRPVAEKDSGFTFPLAAAPPTHSQPPPTPTMPTQFLDKSVLQKEQAAAPVFNFGTKSGNTYLFSSATTSITDSAGVKVGAVSGSELNVANSNATTSASVEGSNLDKTGETQKAGGLFKSLGNAVSSGISTSTTPTVFAFGASATPSLSNGSLHTSVTFSVSSTPGLSNTPGSSIFSNSTANPTSSSSPMLSSAPIFSTVPSFQFGFGTSSAAPVSVSLSEKSSSADLEAKPPKASLFNMPSSDAQATSAVFSSAGTSSSSAVTASSTFSSTGNAPPSALATPAASSSMGISGLSLAPSSAFSSTGSNIFGFSASTQSNSSSSSFVNSSSENSTTAAATIFGTTAGSTSGTQSAQSGNGASLFSQSLTSQFGSFSSSPPFGSSNLSSSGFGVSPFGSTAFGTKPFSSGSGFSFSAGAGSSSASTSSSFAPATSIGLFGSSSQTPTSSIFGSSTSSLSTGLSFGLSASSSGSSPFAFGSSAGSVFSFTSAASTTSSTSSVQPVFGVSAPAIGFGSGSPGNDQMNVEDSMADDTSQAVVPMVPSFGQASNSSTNPSFMFGSPAAPPGGPSPFQFGSQQNPSVPQNPSPFATTGNLDLLPGGSFSLGSGGGDKSGRKFVKVKRGQRKK